MAILERIKAWWRDRKEPSTEPDKDWTTVGKTFRASDVAYHQDLPTGDEGRPPH